MTAPQLQRLDAAHVDELVRASGIRPEVAEAAGLYSEHDARALAKLTRVPRAAWLEQHVPALVFPYFLPDRGAEPVVWRVKPRAAIALGREGETSERKYLHPSGATLHLYFPPSLLDERRRRDSSVGLLITEGEKKTLAAESAGFACIGLSGVSCWSAKRTSSRGPRQLHDDFAHVDLRGRAVAIVFDSDASTVFDVRREENALAEALQRAGAQVRIVRLPHGEGGRKQGLDDFLVASGAQALRELVQSSRVLEISPQVQRQMQRTEAPSPGAALTDLGNAERLVAKHGADLRFVKAWNAWLAWDGMRWARDETGEATRRAIETVRAMYAEAAKVDDADQRKALVEHATRSEGARRIADMLKLGQSLEPIPTTADTWNADPWLCVVENGTLDLRTGELGGHRREDLCTKIVRVPYDPHALCPTWDRFLERVLAGSAELVRFVQRAVGYSLTGSVREQVMFFLYGTGANGKSTFVNTLLALCGEYGHQAAPTLLLATQGERHPAEVADLQGVRFAACVEAKAGQAFDEALLKRITGGDRIAARHMRENWFTFEPTHKLWLAANHKPPIRQQDEGIWRRIRLVPFTVQIPAAERDPELEVKLRRELPGILAWAVRGALEWHQGGLQAPDEVLAATAEYREESDHVGAFIESRCIIASGAATFARDIYAAYEQWCEASGERAMTQRSFGLALTERGLTRRKYGGIFRWLGIGLVDTRREDPPDEDGSSWGRRDHWGRLPGSPTDVRASTVVRNSNGPGPHRPQETIEDDGGRF